MRTYCAKHNKLDDSELQVRKIAQHYVLVAAHSGLRVGEQRQLRWKDVQLEQHSANGMEQMLARIHVRAETSKVRTSRTFLCGKVIPPKNGCVENQNFLGSIS